MIRVVVGDPEDQPTEAALRPVTAQLDGASASSRQLEDRAGTAVHERLQQIGALPAGAAVITPAGDLPFGFLIHAVVQSADEPVSAHTVRNALVNGLRRAEEWDLGSLTLLPLGTGAGNLDADVIAQITAEVLEERLPLADTLDEIVIAVHSEYLAQALRIRLAQSFGEDSVGSS